MRIRKGTLFLLLALLPVMVFALLALFEATGCTGGFNTGGPANPNCILLGIDFGPIYVVAGGWSFAMAILAPFTLAWIVFWLLVLVFYKWKTA